MKRLTVIALAAAALAYPAAGTAAYYPQPWRTVQLGHSCSVTAMGIQRVTTTPNHFRLSFGGGTSCAGTPNTKTLVVELQVLIPHEGWYPRATLQHFKSKANPLRLVGSLSIAGSGTSHKYRIAATARDTYRGITRTATAFSAVLTA